MAPHTALRRLPLAAILTAACAAPEATASRPSCFALPGVGASATQLYRLDPQGRPELTSTAYAPGYHVRAAADPRAGALYVTGVGSAENGVDGVALHAFELSGCIAGPLSASVGAGGESPTNERAYGLVLHPSGRWLYQTTASLREIRRFSLGSAAGAPTPDLAFAPGTGGPECVEIRRLAMSRDGRTLYSNCNNGSSDYAMHVWRVDGEGGLEEIQAIQLDSVDGGIFDPVLHSSGRYLYQPVSTRQPITSAGSGAYILVFEIEADGRLSPVGRTAVRTRTEGDDASSLSRLVYPVTLSLHPSQERGFVTVHANLPSMPTVHEIVEVRVRDGGATLEVSGRIAPALNLEFSSHHGGALLASANGLTLVSFLTDYDTIRGGILQLFDVDSAGRLMPSEEPWTATGLLDGRQVIPIPGGVNRTADG